MSILVTGGTGYLGRAVVEQLVELGQPIVLLVRAGRAIGELPPGVRVVRGDITAIDEVGAAMMGCSTVVHMAAKVSMWDRQPQRFHQVNVEGFKNVVRAASFGAVDRIVYTSTILALGATDGSVGDEDRTPVVQVPANQYMATKVEALQYARDMMSVGAPLLTLYPGIVYGPGPQREAGLMTQMLADLIAGRLPVTIGPADRPWCHSFAADVARGHRLAVETGQSGRSYVLGGVNATVRQWLQAGADATGARMPRWQLPYAVARGIGRLDVARARLGLGGPLLTADAVEVFRHAWAFSSDRAVGELGYRVTSLEEGIRTTARFLGATVR